MKAKKVPLKGHLILIIGFAILISGVLLLVANFSKTDSIFFWTPIFLIGLGSLFLYISFAFKNQSFLVFLGIFLFLCGIIVLLEEVNIIPLPAQDLWPVTVINCGLALIPAGLYKLKRIRTIYFFPAIMLILLGTLFLLFSLGIIKISFVQFINLCWPFFLIVVGLTLIVLFVVQQKTASSFPYMEDDSLVNGDEN